MKLPSQVMTEEQRREYTTFCSLFSKVTRFNIEADARRFAEEHRMDVLMGDWPLYWVCYPSVADKLEAMGYERLPR